MTKDTVLSAEELPTKRLQDELRRAQQGGGNTLPPDELASVLTELLALRHSRASGVRALEWDEDQWPRDASALGLTYHIYGGRPAGNFKLVYPDKPETFHDTIAEAKAAAQSHFNASIQSCLVAEGVEPMVWLVYRTSGEYEDRTEAIIAAYFSEADAKNHAERAVAWWKNNVLGPHGEMLVRGKNGTMDTAPLYAVSGTSPFDNGFCSLEDRDYGFYPVEISTTTPPGPLSQAQGEGV